MASLSLGFLAFLVLASISNPASSKVIVLHCKIHVAIDTNDASASTIIINTSKNQYKEIDSADSGWVKTKITGNKLTYESDEYSFYLERIRLDEVIMYALAESVS
jgi:hypothetical protein